VKEGKREIETNALSQCIQNRLGSSGIFFFSLGLHGFLILIATGITLFLVEKEKDITLTFKREAREEQYDPEIARWIFKTPRILANRIIEKPILIFEEEVEISRDITRGTSFDSLANKNINARSIIDAYGMGGKAAGVYGQRWGKGGVILCEGGSPGSCACCIGGCTGSLAHPEDEGRSAIFFLDSGENPFIDTSWDHLSTFAIDVDTASYTMARSYIEKGELPPKKSIRIEEFINYMNYEYTSPWSDVIAIHLEAAPSKFGREDAHKLMRVAVKGLEANMADRRNAVLTYVIDISGSMSSANRLPLVKKSLKLLLEQLTDGDKVGIIVYSDDAKVVTEPLPIAEREKLIKTIDSLETEGSTNVEAGLMLGYEMADRHFRKHAINRIILCSDGIANTGETSAEKILQKVKTYKEKGIYISTIGFGIDHNDDLMEKLADKADGVYAYIDTPDEATRLFVNNTMGIMGVLAKDMKVQVDFNPDVVDSYRLLGYENRKIADKDFRNDKVDAGEIGPGHSVTALYELKLHDDVAEGIVATVFVRYKDPEYQDEVKEIKQSFPLASIRETFEDASADFRLAAATAELAEVLKDSFFARESDLEPVVELTEYLAHEMYDREEVKELAGLVKKARNIRQKTMQKRVALERSEDNVSRIPRDKSAVIVGLPR